MFDRLRWHEHAAEIDAVLAPAVKVAPAGGNEAVRACEMQETSGGLGCVLAVVRLDPREPDTHQLRQQLVEPEDRPGMRERRDAAVLSYEGHGLDRGEPHARNVRRRVFREQRVERLVIARDVALLEERLRQMRPSERATLRDLQDAGEIHRVAEHVQFFDHQLDAPPPVLAQPAETRLEGRVVRIDEVTEDVRVAPLGFGVELRRWDDLYAERAACRCGCGYLG